MGFLTGIWRSPAALGALLINIAPLIGVLAWDWKVGTLVVLYWLENIVIGVLNVARMVTSGFAHGRSGIAAAAVLTPFFCVHYGLFCFVHGMFVMLLFGNGGDAAGIADPVSLVGRALSVAPNIGIILAIVAAWKASLFMAQFIGGGGYRRSNPADLFAAPYARIIFTHLAIFAGAFALSALGQPIIGVIVLIVVKAVFDAVGELAEARRVQVALKTGDRGVEQHRE